MVETILKVQGMMCGMCESHINDVVRKTAQVMLQHLSLLFIPAGTGVMLHFQRMSAEWLPLLISLVASTLITIAVTALVLRFLSRRRDLPQETP